jgi:hypothetical protein
MAESETHRVSWDNPTDRASGWARFSQGNGGANVKNKTKFKGFPRQAKIYVDKGKTHREFKVGTMYS